MDGINWLDWFADYDVDWLAVNAVLNICNVALTVFVVFLFWRSAHLKADAVEVLHLAQANMKVALDIISSLRKDTRGLTLGMRMAADEAAQKLKTEAAKVKAIKESGTVHLPAGSELTVRAEPDQGGESER